MVFTSISNSYNCVLQLFWSDKYFAQLQWPFATIPAATFIPCDHFDSHSDFPLWRSVKGCCSELLAVVFFPDLQWLPGSRVPIIPLQIHNQLLHPFPSLTINCHNCRHDLQSFPCPAIPSMDFNGFLMNFNEFHWIFNEFHWISMDFQWISMDFDGF